MLFKKYALLVIAFLAVTMLSAQEPDLVNLKLVKKEIESLPGQIVNIPCFIQNNSADTIDLSLEIDLPEGWKIISKPEVQNYKSSEKTFAVISIQIPSFYSVGKYINKISLKEVINNSVLSTQDFTIEIQEKEDISLQLISSPEFIISGDTACAVCLIQNDGNTEKNIIFETINCNVQGQTEIKLKPGETSRVNIFQITSANNILVSKEYFSVKALLAGNVKQKVFGSYTLYPTQKYERDIYFRYPITASATYLAASQNNQFQSAFQFELIGDGPLNSKGNHYLSFLARGPNRADLSFLGMYSQYYISYINPNYEISVGQKSYTFTQLTESSRYGMGVENKFKLNSGLSIGYIWVKPLFFEYLKNEMSVYTEFETKNENIFKVCYVLKSPVEYNEKIHLASFSTHVKPIKQSTFDMEVSSGTFNNTTGYAVRAGLSSQFSIFRVFGNYYYIDENYPGYYSNSTFYSGSLSAQVSRKVSLGIYARKDFSNAQLDTFFVTAPYSNSYQIYMNYNPTNRTSLRMFWRDLEKKDRLQTDKFHYNTKSLNLNFRRRAKNFEYDLSGEYGKTANYLLDSKTNEQNSYRGSSSVTYRFNMMHSVRVFGSYSNINSFVSDRNQNLSAGISISSQVVKNFKVNLHLQNAYDIEYYSRNRNLFQLQAEYNFLKNHTISLRSYYTLFKEQTENPELILGATYRYKFGIPLSKIAQVGSLMGQIVNSFGEPMQGVVINILNRSDITNKNGEFEFHSLEPGIHVLTIDRNKFEIDEVLNIPSPVKADIFENEQTILKLQAVKAAKVSGQFKIEIDKNRKNDNSKFLLSGIIVELKSEFQEFRILTEKDGSFKFPLCLPAEYQIKVYSNSLPENYTLEKSIVTLNLKPKERIDLEFVLKPKKRNIVFKNEGFSLSSGNMSLDNLQKSNAKPQEKANDNFYYTIQVGAFQRKIKKESRFFRYRSFDKEMLIDNLYKYFIGNFKDIKTAEKENIILQKHFNNSFIVKINNGKVEQINNAEK